MSTILITRLPFNARRAGFCFLVAFALVAPVFFSPVWLNPFFLVALGPLIGLPLTVLIAPLPFFERLFPLAPGDHHMLDTAYLLTLLADVSLLAIAFYLVQAVRDRHRAA